MNQEPWDVIIIGAGAAGLMTAITCRQKPLKVLLLDGKEKIGAKILMSGGTRCNVTNAKVTEKDFWSESPRTVRNILQTYPSEKAAAFFESIGVHLIQEDHGKYFPNTHSGRTVLEALMKEAVRAGVVLENPRKIREITWQEGLFSLRSPEAVYTSRSVVLCTGGLSYPSSGSDGTGYALAQNFGHHLVPTTPALTPLTTDDPDWKSLSGISLPCRLILKAGAKTLFDVEGDFLFTHFGFSGPAALNMSRHWIRSKHLPDLKLFAQWNLKEHEQAFREKLKHGIEQNPSWSTGRFLAGDYPERLIEQLLKKSGIPGERKLNQLTRENRETLIRALFQTPLSVTGVLGYEKAEVTAGGVGLGEVDPHTLESKLRPGLFFAGEILDVDGRIGGFNFQWAWSSGYAVGMAVIKKSAGLRTGN